jgi:hypothetical protein
MQHQHSSYKNSCPQLTIAKTFSRKVEIKKLSIVDFIFLNLTRLYNSSNNKNSEFEYEKNLHKVFYIYGGYVRDSLLGIPYNDIDLFIQYEFLVINFIKFLESCGRLVRAQQIYATTSENHKNLASLDNLCNDTKLYNYDSGYYSMYKVDIEYDGEIVSLDITHDNSSDYPVMEQNTETCDFTVNNLVLYHDGNINARLPPPNSLNLTPYEWKCRCIRDCIQKKLFWMVDKSSTYHREIDKHAIKMKILEKRLEKMIDKGFEDTKENLCSIPLNFNNYVKDTNELCSICRGVYKDEPERDTIQFKCGHHHHLDCWLNWCKSSPKSKENCIYCRQPIVL